ncbi:anaerobic ribonucleoside-triphosphate reductase activating protein [Christensenellaceae bacterium OttesenSCG-928-K19]|nr:anaerobic ribonucleoside-triphosphate reductase activating protein [Christensenellaceae bacterium OttesenSCG-928-K19]
MNIAGIQKTSTVDFPGLLAAVVFTAGCNYNCFYCHNRHLLGDSPLLDNGEILRFLEKRAGMLDGIVVSGGEPTLQKDLHEFLSYAKELGYAVKLDTNGSNPKAVDRLLKENLLDYVALDYKAPFDHYEELCGLPGDDVKRTAELLLHAGIQFEMRTTMIPQISQQDLRKMADALPPLPAYLLQLYRPQPGDTKHLKTLLPYTPSEIARLADSIRDAQPNVGVR